MQPNKMDHCHVRATILILVFVLVSVSALRPTNLTSSATFPSAVSAAGKTVRWRRLGVESVVVNGISLYFMSDCLLVCGIGLLFWRKSREVNHECCL